MAAVNLSTPIETAFNTNASELNRAVADVQITSNGVLDLTLIDASVVTNTIPFFPDYVISGLLLTFQAPPNALTLDYTDGSYQINGIQYSIGVSGTIGVTPGDVAFDRRDIIYVDNLNTINYLAGTASAIPVPPTQPANSIIIANIFVKQNATAAATDAFVSYTKYYINENIVIESGTGDGEVFYWDEALQKYISSPALKTDGLTVGVNITPGSEALSIDGRIEMEDVGAPGTTTNKLYNDAGDLYWDGQLLNSSAAVATNTTNGTLLIGDGLGNWNESTNLTVFSGAIEIDSRNITLDNVAPPASPSSGFRLFSNADDAFIITPTNTYNLTGAGTLPSGGPNGTTLRWNGTNWVNATNVVNTLDNFTINTSSGTNSVLSTFDANTPFIRDIVGDGTVTSQRVLSNSNISNTITDTTNTYSEIYDISTGIYNRNYIGPTFTWDETLDTSGNSYITTLTNGVDTTDISYYPDGIVLNYVGANSGDIYLNNTNIGMSYTSVIGNSSISLSDGKIGLNGGIVYSRRAIAVNYTTLTTDYIIYCTVGAITISLDDTLDIGTTFIIKDLNGNAGTSPITIDTTGAGLIDGAATRVLNTNYSTATIQKNAVNVWSIL